VTFQVLLLTDGTRSFSAFLYGPIAPEAAYLIGFNAGDQIRSVVILSTDVVGTGGSLQSMAFRIDGEFMAIMYSALQVG
jgi:hypothetical protein